MYGAQKTSFIQHSTGNSWHTYEAEYIFTIWNLVRKVQWRYVVVVIGIVCMVLVLVSLWRWTKYLQGKKLGNRPSFLEEGAKTDVISLGTHDSIPAQTPYQGVRKRQ